MGTTANYSWPTPVATDLVKDGWEAIKDLGDAADTTVKAVSDAQGLVHIQTTDFSGASSHSFGSDASPIFTSDYKNYRIILDDLETITSTRSINLRLRANTTDLTDSDYDIQNLTASSTTIGGGRSSSQTSGQIGNVGYAGDKSSILLELQNPQIAKWKNYISSCAYTNTGTGISLFQFSGLIRDTGQFNGFTIFATGNFSGTMSVYGYNI